MRAWFGVAAAAALAAGLTGCGDSGPKKLAVSGSVQFDGKDVPEGDILFVPEARGVGPEGGKIKDGKYTASVPEGKYKVEVTATRVVPGKKGPMGTEDLLEDYIPAKYNQKTELTAEVSGGKTTHDFPLKK